MNTFKSILTAWALLLLPAIFVTCDDDKEEITIPPENSIPGQEVGIRQLSLKVPRLGRLEVLFSRVNCRIHLKGIGDRVTYPINTFLSADADTLLVEAEDPILSELPHQQYYLNYITFPKKDLTVKAETAETAESAIVQDTIYLGARLSIEDPNNIAFRSSFNKKADCMGSGKEDDPINIACGLDFVNLVAGPLTEGDDLKGKVIHLTENINLLLKEFTNGKGWEPAGHHNIKGGYTEFKGTLNGNGNIIEDLFCHTSEGYGGLFYCLGPTAYIHDIQFKNVSLDGGDNLGAVACRAISYNGSTPRLENISVEGYISGKNNIGGLVGEGGSEVTRCISSVAIHAKGPCSNVGGMVGNSGSIFTDCIRTGLIDAPSATNVGGFVGSGAKSFTRCYVSGTIKGGNMTGGIIGNSSHITFTDCQVGVTINHDSYAYPWDVFLDAQVHEISMDIQGNDYVGGFIGSGRVELYGRENAFKYKNTSTPSLTGNNYVGGLGGSMEDFRFQGNAKFTSYAYIQANDFVGGIIGEVSQHLYSEGSFINEGTVHGNDHVGGIFGYCQGSENGSFTNIASINGRNYVGGIAGKMRQSGRITIVNDGDVIATGDYVGGLFGYLGDLNIREGSRVSKDGGSLKIQGGNNVGGIAGQCNGLIKFIPPCYANIIAKSNVGGLYGFIGFMDVLANWNLFGTVSPGRVTITADPGNSVGGAIGLLQVDSKKPDVYSVTVNGIKQLQGSIKAKGNGVGGIVGRAENYHCRSLHFTNCDNHMNVTSESPSHVEAYAGIIGVRYDEGYEIRVTSCSNQGNVYGSVLSAAGGIAGQMKENIYIDQCYNTGTIDGTSAVGGIMGRVFDYSIVSNCFNMGSVPWASNKSLLAGLVGQKEDKSKKEILIENCYNIGETGWGIIGGENKAKVRCVNCYYLNTASNGDMKGSGSHAKTADEMRRKATYVGFSKDIWHFHYDGEVAPVLNSLHTPSPYPLQK